MRVADMRLLIRETWFMHSLNTPKAMISILIRYFLSRGACLLQFRCQFAYTSTRMSMRCHTLLEVPIAIQQTNYRAGVQCGMIKDSFHIRLQD